MSRHELSHLSDQALTRTLEERLARVSMADADALAYLAEYDARKLFLPAGYESMLDYCVHNRHLCEQAALKRIRVARTARRFPAIFDALAYGRLFLSGVILLAPHLTEDNANELLTAATHKTRSEIEKLLAERFPKSDMFAWTAPVAPADPVGPAQDQLSPGTVVTRPTLAPAPRVKPLGPQSFALQCTLSKAAHEKLRYAQELLSHQVQDGEIGAVIERALDALIPQLERRKFAATTRPRRSHRRASPNHRHIPADVMRAVWERDGGQCTFVSESGHRCQARKRLEFDHVLEVARGGVATVEGMRIRCRAHNQYAAECTFGSEFMRHKRIAASEARAAARALKATAPRKQPGAPEHVEEVIPWLRALGFNAAEARCAAERCQDMAGATLEERVRVALRRFRARGTRVERPMAVTAQTAGAEAALALT